MKIGEQDDEGPFKNLGRQLYTLGELCYYSAKNVKSHTMHNLKFFIHGQVSVQEWNERHQRYDSRRVPISTTLRAL